MHALANYAFSHFENIGAESFGNQNINVFAFPLVLSLEVGSLT